MTLEIRDLYGGYGDTLIHRGLSLDVGAGQVLAIIGRNGTGKTTLARLIAGDLPAAGGRIVMDDVEITRYPAFRRARLGISVMPQVGMVFDTLTVAENLALTGAPGHEIEGYIDYFPRLGERAKQIAGSMSGGERKVLGFVRAALWPGNLIVFDEPSEGVQPENIASMQDILARMRDRNRAIVLMEQNISMIEAIADHVVALDSRGVCMSASRADMDRETMLRVLSV